MAPPTEPLSPKKVQVSSGVARKNSDNEGESIEEDIVSALSTASTILATDLLEAEKPESPKVTVSSPVRPKKLVPVEDEATFLARLSYIWKGFVNMPSVARFVIKAYPVSGALDCLTEDLPDSIQVGGRISPQTVWDYVEKIKASGTKETCLIRFCPATEEDQISYTLLFAYFSSRRRYGVVANNMRQVKDMYLIPLGATERIPRFLVPFDGPGLESRRPNLLLALIIRQRMKRSLSTSIDDDSLGLSLDVTPEKRAKNEASHKDVDLEEDEDENDFFNSFTAVLHKGRNRPQDLGDDDHDDDDDDDNDDDKDEPEATVEPASVIGKSEPLKPLRFLPGVLVGWENQSSALDLANKPLPVDDILQSLLGDGENIFESEMALDETSKLIDEKMTDELNSNCVSETKVRHVSGTKAGIKKSQDCPAVKKAMDSPVVKNLYATRTLKTISLKGKPPDISTEAFLANLSCAQSHEEGLTTSKERKTKCTLDEPKSTLHESELNTDTCFSASNDFNDKLAPVDGTGNSPRTKKFFVKRDPRQAAVRTSPFSSSYSKARDCNKIQESQNAIEQEHLDISGNASKYNESKNSSNVKDSFFSDRSSASQNEGSKYFHGDTLQNLQTLHSYGTNAASTTAKLEIVNTSPSDSGSTTGEIYSSVRHPHSLPQNTKPFQSLFHIPPPQNYPAVYGFPPRMPPPLLPPPGYGFPRGPCLRSRSLEPAFPNPMFPWPPIVPLPGHPSHFFGPVPQGIPSLAPGQPRCLRPPTLFHRDDHLPPGRRHSDPWDRHELYAERHFNRDCDGQHRQRFYSESYHERKNRINDTELKNEKYSDRDSTRNRHRERDRSQEKESERKGRDETHRDKDGHRGSRSDRSTDHKTHKESKNPDKNADKSKHEHSIDREREKSKDRNRDSERDRERHSKDKVPSDRVKLKR